MKFDFDASASAQGHDNAFTLSEVTPKGKGSITYVRELTNSVLTDIPLFMSHHRGRMIESVGDLASLRCEWEDSEIYFPCRFVGLRTGVSNDFQL